MKYKGIVFSYRDDVPGAHWIPGPSWAWAIFGILWGAGMIVLGLAWEEKSVILVVFGAILFAQGLLAADQAVAEHRAGKRL